VSRTSWKAPSLSPLPNLRSSKSNDSTTCIRLSYVIQLSCMPRFPLNVFFWPLAKVHDKSEPCPSLLLLKPSVASESAKASLACLSEHKSPANVRAHPGGSRDAGALCYVCFCCRLLHSSFPSLRHCGFSTFQFISISILHSLFGLDNFFQRNSHSLNASSGVLPWYLDFH